MTNKQLLKGLQSQQNKLLNIKGYSFYLSTHNNEDIEICFKWRARWNWQSNCKTPCAVALANRRHSHVIRA